jgi:hypothetical protein
MCFKSFFHSTNLEDDIIRIVGYINDISSLQIMIKICFQPIENKIEQ